MLIQLVSIHPSPSPQSVPLASAFLASYVRERHDIPVGITECYCGDDAELCAEQIATLAPRAVGFSLYVWNRTLACAIARSLRRLRPSLLIFCGGPEVSADPHSILGDGAFDFAITGEGEVPFASFCHQLTRGDSYTHIPGICMPGEAPSPPSPPLHDLDEIPSPYLTGILDARSTPGLLWQLSRGCSFTCDFCFDARGIHGVRYFSLQRLEAELRHFADCGVTQIFVLDSTFNRDRKRAKQILSLIAATAPDIHFHFEVRSEFIDREMAELFASFPCSLQIGLQSSDPAVLAMVGRTFDKGDFSSKTEVLNESGAVFGFDLMYGLPGDTLEGFRRSLDFALSLYPNHLDIFPLAVLPGTRLAEHAAQLGLVWNRQAPYLVESTGGFSPADMAAAAELATSCDVLYTRGKAVAWFNAVSAALSMKPSDVLQSFSCFLNERHGSGTRESDFDEEEVWDLQLSFFTHLFSSGRRKRYLPLVRDLILYHRLYATVLLAPVDEPHTEGSSAHPAAAAYRISPAARLAEFAYDIDELLECGEPHLPWMAENLTRTGSRAVIYRTDGSIHTESLAPPYFNLLQQIRSTGRIQGGSRTGMVKREIDEFLSFALQEGFILVA